MSTGDRESPRPPEGRFSSSFALGRFWRNSKGVLLSPKRFYSGASASKLDDPGFRGPLLFAFLWIVFFYVVTGFWNFAVFDQDPWAYLISVLAGPPIYGVGVLLIGALIHLFVRAFVGARNAGFRSTLAVYCYAMAIFVMYVIPFVGGYIAQLWLVYLTVVGLRQVHSGTTVSAAGAVLAAYGIVMFGGLAVGSVVMIALVEVYGASLLPDIERVVTILFPS